MTTHHESVRCGICGLPAASCGDFNDHLARLNVAPVPTDELRALIEADTLHMLPKEALIASIKHLAARLLALQNDGGTDG